MTARWPTSEQWIILGVGALFVIGGLVGKAIITPSGTLGHEVDLADPLLARLSVLWGAGCMTVGLVSILRSWRREQPAP